MLDPGEVAQARLGLTPAKAPPKNFKNAENLEFFEAANGLKMFRMKESVRKGKEGGRKGLGQVPAQEGGIVLRPKRMNLSTKKNNLGQHGTQSPRFVPRIPLQAVQSASRVQNSKSVLDSLAPPLHRQSISERKDVGKNQLLGRSKLPMPPPQAKKGLSFRTPKPNSHEYQPPSTNNKSSEAVKPAVTITDPTPERKEEAPHAFRNNTLELSSQERFQPASLDMFKSPGEEEFHPQRPSFLIPRDSAALDARESLAWVGSLHRQSVHFKELQKQMNENDKRHVNDDDTDSFEAMERRMKTPVKKVKMAHPTPHTQSQIAADDENKLLEAASEVPGPSFEVKEVSEDESRAKIELNPSPRDVSTMKAPQDEAEAIDHFDHEQNKENIAQPEGQLGNEAVKAKVYKKKHQLFGGGFDVAPSFSPLRQTKSLDCLLAPSKNEEVGEDEENIVPLCRATSNIQLGEGEEVVLSDLVPAEQVEQALRELDNQQEELRKIKEEQDELAAKTAEVMLAVQQRRDRFRQLWGVSPLRINTMRTVIPRKVAVVEEEMSSGHENAEEVDSTIEDSGRLEESYEETGVVPLPLETPAASRKVRFNSGNNETHALTPKNQTEEEVEEGGRTPLGANASNQSFAALKTSFSFLATPQPGRGGTPHLARNSGVSLKAEATPVALRKLGDRVRDEWAKLYADNSEEEDSLQFPAPAALKF